MSNSKLPPVALEDLTVDLDHEPVTGGAGTSRGTGSGSGKVSMQDFHFVIRHDTSSP